MLSRRTLLGTATLGAGWLLLPGCALIPPGAEPSLVPPPTSGLLPGQQALLMLHAGLDAAAATASDPERPLLAWAQGVVAEQLTAVSLGDRTSLAPGSSAGPGPAASSGPSTSSDAAVGTGTPPSSPTAAPSVPAADLLAKAATAFAEQAVAADSAQPHIWASMAAWARSTAGQLPTPTAPREPARGVLDPPAQTPAEAVQSVLDAAAQVVWGIQTAAGTPGLTASELDAARARIHAWWALRDTVEELATPAASPTAPAPWFDLDRPVDAVAARAELARLESAALPVLGRAIAFGPDAIRPALVDAVADAALAIPAWGGLLQRWPGLPIT